MKKYEHLLKKTDWEKFLYNYNKYTWQDIVSFSIEKNISIERLLSRIFKDLERYKIKELTNFIFFEVKKTDTRYY